MAIHNDTIHWLNFNSYEDIRFYEIGNQRCHSGYSYGPIIRDKYVLHYIVSGEGILKMNDTIYEIHEKQLFIIPPGVLAYYQASTEHPWHYMWLQFHGPKSSELLQMAGLTQKHPVFIANGNTQSIEDCFLHILDHPTEEYTCMGKLYEFFQQLITLSGNQSSSVTETDPALKYSQMVINYISEKYSEPIHIQEIANYCGLDRTYLGKLFKKATGRTPKEYLIQFRMNHAKQLLQDPGIPIRYVGYSIGYSDQLTFSKLFRQETGMSPTQYRKKITQEE